MKIKQIFKQGTGSYKNENTKKIEYRHNIGKKLKGIVIEQIIRKITK